MNLEKQIIDDIYSGRSTIKYSYVDVGANNFIRVINSNCYYYYRIELALVRNNIAAIRRSFRETIVVLGVGDGSKLSCLLSDEYNTVLVDISAELLHTVQKRIPKAAIVLNTSFETVDYQKLGDNMTFLLLGGTLCNIEAWSDFLTRLREECPMSNVIIGMEFADEEDHKVGERIRDGYSSAESEEFLFYPLSLLGISRDDGTVEVIYNESLHRIESYFVFNSQGKAIWLRMTETEPPSRVLLNVSNKPTRAQFFQTANRLGLRRGQLDCSTGSISIIELYW